MGEQTTATAALTQAMINEKDSIDFYTHAAETTDDPRGKDMYNSLVRDEEQHLRILQAEYLSLTGGQRWIDLEAARQSEPPDPSVVLFPQDRSELDELLAAAPDELSALQVAMQFEYDGWQMYANAATETDDPLARDVYEFLAQEEKRHYTLLEGAHKYLAHKGLWFFDEEELPFFEG